MVLFVNKKGDHNHLTFSKDVNSSSDNGENSNNGKTSTNDETSNIIETSNNGETSNNNVGETSNNSNNDSEYPRRLIGKERINVAKEIIEHYDGNCDRYRKTKLDQKGEGEFYSLETLKKAKSETIFIFAL